MRIVVARLVASGRSLPSPGRVPASRNVRSLHDSNLLTVVQRLASTVHDLLIVITVYADGS